MHESLPNTIDYVEMPSKDLAATKDFFTQLFGWSFQDYGPDYCAFDDGRMTGGFFASEKHRQCGGRRSADCVLSIRSRKDLRRSRAGSAEKLRAKFSTFPGAVVFISKRPVVASSRSGRSRLGAAPGLLSRKAVIFSEQ